MQYGCMEITGGPIVADGYGTEFSFEVHEIEGEQPGRIVALTVNEVDARTIAVALEPAQVVYAIEHRYFDPREGGCVLLRRSFAGAIQAMRSIVTEDCETGDDEETAQMMADYGNARLAEIDALYEDQSEFDAILLGDSSLALRRELVED